MRIVYTQHANERLRQRGFLESDIEYLIRHPMIELKTYDDKRIAIGFINNRKVRIIFMHTENYIKVITVI